MLKDGAEREGQIVDRLMSKLPEIGKKVVESCPSDQDPHKAGLLEDPDDPKEHSLGWHQFGIISHTKEFLRVHRGEVAEYLEDWEVGGVVSDAMAEEVDGRSKSELFELAIILHDVGKFSREMVEIDGKTVHDPVFQGHATKSKDLILGGLKDGLKLEYGLTDDQIEYIGTCADMHYELGNIRDQIRAKQDPYTLKTVKGEDCGEMLKAVVQCYPDMNTEIGLLFIGDSLAKTDVRIDVDSDEELESRVPELEGMIRERGLHPNLIHAAKQRPVSIALARHYFEILRDEKTKDDE